MLDGYALTCRVSESEAWLPRDKRVLELLLAGGAGFENFLGFGDEFFLRFAEGAEDGEVFDVFLEVFAFGGFEAAGMSGETRVVDDMAEGFLADFSLADAGVAIDAGTEFGFGIVEVEGVGSQPSLRDLRP